MTAPQAHEIILLIKAATSGVVDQDTLDYFGIAMLKLDYDKALGAATVGVGVWNRFPSWAQFRQMYGDEVETEAREVATAERRREAQEVPSTKVLAFWVKRWIAARFLYARFGRDKDTRPFPEQRTALSRIDSSIEWMPEDEWQSEGEKVSDKDVWGSLLR